MKPTFNILRSCHRKTRYPTRKIAKERAGHCHLQFYQCTFCKGYHLTNGLKVEKLKRSNS